MHRCGNGILVLLSGFMTWFLTAGAFGADIHEAKDCSYAEVSAAVSAAHPGDTVLVPAGIAVWPGTLIINKSVILKGAGAGQTMIQAGFDAPSQGNGAVQTNYLLTYAPPLTALDQPFRLSGFTFDAANRTGGLCIWNTTTTLARLIRVDHLEIKNARYSGGTARALLIFGNIFGVIDNNDFSNNASGISIYGTNKSGWDNLTYTFGNADNIYIEDNTFTSADTVHDGGAGGRYCARYNTYTHIGAGGLYPLCDMHGNMGSQGNYAMMGGEIYGNLVVMQNNKGVRLFDLRGGKALCFGNKTITTSASGITVREENDDALNPTTNLQPQHITDSYFWNNRGNGGKLFGATEVMDGHFAASSIGSDWVECNGRVFSDYYPGKCGVRIKTGPGAGQERGIYALAHNGSRLMIAPAWTVLPEAGNLFDVVTDYGNIIDENVNYFNHQAQFDGATGMGCGPGNQPPVHGVLVGVGYWLTNQDCTQVSDDNIGAHPKTPISGTLYKCTAPNVWTAYYTPYTYPHPLRTSGPLSDPLLTILSPNGGGNWQIGTTQTVRWTANDMTGDVNIELYKDNSKVQDIGTVAASSGTTPWLVPDSLTAGSDYKLHIYQDSVADYSDESFSINSLDSLYAVKFSAGPGGTVSGDVNQIVSANESTSEVRAVPSSGYVFSSWSGDISGTTNPLIIGNVQYDMRITAQFVPGNDPEPPQPSGGSGGGGGGGCFVIAADPEFIRWCGMPVLILFFFIFGLIARYFPNRKLFMRRSERMKSKTLFLIAFLFLVLFGAPAQAATTYYCDTCSLDDVVAKVALAQDGDMVQLPVCAETDYPAWTNYLNITKAIILKGAGVDATKIKGNFASSLGLIRYQPSAPSKDHRFRMTGFTIDTDSKEVHAFSCYQPTVTPEYIQIDHMKVYAWKGRAFYIAGTFFGAIRNNDIHARTAISTYGSGDTQWKALYANPPTLTRNYGDDKNLYFEDNIVDGGIEGGFSASGQGGRRVLRYNTFSAYHLIQIIDVHGNQPGGGGNIGDHPGGNCATQVTEIYGNALTDTEPNSYGQILDQRGGQVLFYFNVKFGGQSRSTAQAREEDTDSLWPVNNGWVQKVTNSYHWGNWENGNHLVVTEIGTENSGSEIPSAWLPNHLYGSASPLSDIYSARWINDPTGNVWKKTTYSDDNGSPNGLVSPYLTGTTEPDWASVPPRHVIVDGNIHWINLGQGTPIALNQDLWVQTAKGTFDGTGDPDH
ncbi:MAG: hypothetical protein EHM45_01815, partial [Desulfobacteraceae bacterium]